MINNNNYFIIIYILLFYCSHLNCEVGTYFAYEKKSVEASYPYNLSRTMRATHTVSFGCRSNE